MEIEWTSKAARASNAECNCRDYDRVNGENGMALSHRLAAGVVRLLYKSCGQHHFPFSNAHVIENDREG